MSKALAVPPRARRPPPPSRPVLAAPEPHADPYAAWARAAAWPDVPAEVPLGRFDALRAALGVTQGALAEAVGVHPRTVQRRRAEGGGLAGPGVAEAFVRVERLFGLAVHVFGSPAAAAAWFTGDVPLLADRPLAAVRTERGARAAEQVLGAVEFGFAA